jgi:hypothetical protein
LQSWLDRLAWLLGALLVGLALQGASGLPWGDAPLLYLNTSRLLEHPSPADWLGYHQPQPPLGYLPLLLGQWLRPEAAPLIASTLAILLLGQGMLRLGAGWLVVLVVLASPMTGRAFAEYGWDLAAAAVVVQVLAAKKPVGRGLWLAAALLTKYSTAFYLVFPVALWVLDAIKNPEKRRDILKTGITALLLLLPFLLNHASALLSYIGGSLSQDVSSITLNGRSLEERLSLSGILSYPLAIKDALSWPGLILLGLGWWKKSDRTALWTAVIAICLLSLLPAALDRYALPAVVLIALGAEGKFPQKTLLFSAVFGIQAIGTLKNLAGPPSPIPSYDRPLSTITALSWPESPSYRPARLDTTELERVVEKLLEKTGLEPQVVALYLPFDGRLPDTGVFAWLAWKKGARFELRPVRPLHPEDPVTIPEKAQTLLYLAETEAGLQHCLEAGFLVEERISLSGRVAVILGRRR